MGTRFATRSLMLGAVMVVLFGWVFLPRAFDAFTFLLRADDPIEIATYRIRQLSEDDYDLALQEALEDGGFSLARQFVEFADENEIQIADKHRVAANPSLSRQLGQVFSDSAIGALTGDFNTASGLAGAIASDLTGVGDVRDVIIEGKLAIQGQDYDSVVLGLAAAGIVLTGSTLLSAGVASPADTGVSVMKNAYKAGKISQPLLKHIRRSMDGLVDVKLLRTQFSTIASVRPSRAKAIVVSSLDVGKLNALTDLSKNVGKVSANADLSTAVLVLHYAENGEDLVRAAKLSSHFGKKSRAILSLLGRGALVATGLFFTVSAWILAGVFWMFSAVLIAYRVMRMILSIFWRRA